MAQMGNWNLLPYRGGVLQMYRSCEEAFENQACCGNIAITKFCLKRVDPVLRQDLIIKAAKLVVDPDDVFYLLIIKFGSR